MNHGPNNKSESETNRISQHLRDRRAEIVQNIEQ